MYNCFVRDPVFEAKNRRRHELIEKEKLTLAEEEELAGLQEWISEYLDEVAPLPTERLEEIERKLGIDPNTGEKMRYRYNPNDDHSPGNFRRPTIEKSKEHLDWWAAQGVEKLSDFNQFDMTDEERALEKIRWSEAKHYYDRFSNQAVRHTTDSYVYRKPIFSEPDPEAEDYGDFEPVSPDAARQYLYNFFSRQVERDLAGLPMQDVDQYPWRPRYDECVALLGQEEVNRIEDEIFGRQGLELVRRNPVEAPASGACASCGRIDCPCGCGGDPILCTCHVDQPCANCGRRDCSCGCQGDPELCICKRGLEHLHQGTQACARCGMVDCPCGCDGDPSLCRCPQIGPRRNPQGVCAACGMVDCPCGCGGDPSLCRCPRENPNLYDRLSDMALNYAYLKGQRRRNPGFNMPW